MHYKRNACEFSDLYDPFKIQVGLGGIKAVYRAHGCRQGIDPRILYIPCSQVRIRIRLAHFLKAKFPPLMPGHDPDLRLHIRARCLCQGHYLLCHTDIFLIGKGGPIVHNSAETNVQGPFHILYILAVVQHYTHGYLGILCHTHHNWADHVNGHLALMQLGVLDNNGLVPLFGRPQYRHQYLQIRCVKGSDTAPAVLCILQDLIHIN